MVMGTESSPMSTPLTYTAIQLSAHTSMLNDDAPAESAASDRASLASFDPGSVAAVVGFVAIVVTDSSALASAASLDEAAHALTSPTNAREISLTRQAPWFRSCVMTPVSSISL